jgi:hypothetical protein
MITYCFLLFTAEDWLGFGVGGVECTTVGLLVGGTRGPEVKMDVVGLYPPSSANVLAVGVLGTPEFALFVMSLLLYKL